MWSPHNFKGQVSPHELLQAPRTAQRIAQRIAHGAPRGALHAARALCRTPYTVPRTTHHAPRTTHHATQAVAHESDNRYKIGTQTDPMDFLGWLLNALHAGLGGTRKPGSSIIHKAFQVPSPPPPSAPVKVVFTLRSD